MSSQEKLDIENVPNSLPPKVTKENIDPNVGTRKSTVLFWTRCIIYTVIASLLVSFAAYCLIVPNDFTIGGAAGIAILINVASDGKIPQSILSLSLNLPLIVLAFFFVKRKFAILSTLNITLQSIWLYIIEKVLPDFRITFPGDGSSKIFAALGAGLCIGVALALSFKAGGSTGGADILAVMIQKHFKATSISWMLFFINCTIIGCSLFVFPAEYDANGNIYYGAMLLPIMMAAFEAFIESRTNESITNGFHSAVEFRIITDKPDELATVLMHELSRGVTAIPAKGMYSKEMRSMLLCVVSRRQVPVLRKVMKEVDPDSFAVMSKVSQVLGLGFYSDEFNS